MSVENPHRRSGVAMLWIAWLLLLGGGWWVADHWLAQQANPNQQPVITANGEVVLQRNRDGHYVADGEINGHKVTFMVDTGATSVALSSRLARVIDVKRGAAIQVDTANGLALGYQTRLNTVRLGDIVVHEVSAVFSDGMTDDMVLLGMSFLKHVEFTQRANQLTLRAVR
jgi:aspartyl protease family protein